MRDRLATFLVAALIAAGSPGECLARASTEAGAPADARISLGAGARRDAPALFSFGTPPQAQIPDRPSVQTGPNEPDARSQPGPAADAGQSSTADASPPTSAPSFSLGGLLSGAALTRLDSPFTLYGILRAIPELKFSLPAGRGLTFDGELSANAWVDYSIIPSFNDRGGNAGLDPYRAWLRLSTSRFEARLGLQKLSFGSATLFRPLMWFDSLDPRDPLQLTDGVYGLLLRYYFAGNANVWAWGLYGNEDRRGFDLAPPDPKTPEFGGRLELPLAKLGEIGATYHRRKTVIEAIPLAPAPEDRFGLDGKLDLGIGVWFEGTLVHQHLPLALPPPLPPSLPPSLRPYQRALTLGLDYTFALGRGLTAVAEHFRLASSDRAFSAGDGLSFTALLLRYPAGLLDQLSGIFYYDWENRDFYRFLSWTRTTDALTISAIAFWNPAEPFAVVFSGRAGSSSFAGTGLELILAYNF